MSNVVVLGFACQRPAVPEEIAGGLWEARGIGIV